MKDYIEQCKFPLLVAAYSSDDVNSDNMAESYLTLFYVLKKMHNASKKDACKEIFTSKYQKINKLKKFIQDQRTDQSSEYYGLLHDADFGKRTIDPEYNFMDCVGWSLKFDYRADGLL